MMSAKGTNLRPEINMNTYAKYKYELGIVMSAAQMGQNNSCYGLHWYTNIDTGKSKKFDTKPNNRWFLGRNLFSGEHCSIPYMKNKKVSNSLKNYYKTHEHNNKGRKRTFNIKNKIIAYNIYTLEKLICKDSFIPKDYITPYKKAYEKNKEIKAKQFWDEFHSGDYKSFNEFSKTLNVSQPYLTELLKSYIPKYKEICKKRFDTKPDKSLIGVYEQMWTTKNEV